MYLRVCVLNSFGSKGRGVNEESISMKIQFAGLIVVGLLLSACERVGSDAWCEKLGERPKGEWTGDEKKQHTKYCVLGFDSEKWCEKLEKTPKGDWTANEGSTYAKNCVFGRSEDETEADGEEG
jgi:hypothetical protein